MDWPSKNVAPGGVFQPTKVNYSAETRDFLKTLIEETKMSTMQRSKINYSLRSGDPLPPLDSFQGNEMKKKSSIIIIRPGSSKKRSQTTIIEMGAYDREKFKPTHPRVDREKAKEELADRMAYGKIIHPQPPKINKKTSGDDKNKKEPLNRYEEIKLEIKDREEWLKNMENLGEGDKHRAVITLQIEEKLRELERLKISEL